MKKELNSENQYTGEFNYMLLIDSTRAKVHIVKITGDTCNSRDKLKDGASLMQSTTLSLVTCHMQGPHANQTPARRKPAQ